MMIPHKCPKCDGTGWLQFNPKLPFSTVSDSAGPWMCDVCQSGVIYTTSETSVGEYVAMENASASTLEIEFLEPEEVGKI